MAKDARINLVIESGLLQDSKMLAGVQGISLSELICTLLIKHVERNAETLKTCKELQAKIKHE